MSLNAISATKAAWDAYEKVKIAIAAAGHLAPSDHQTMYAAPTIWHSIKVLITQRGTLLELCRKSSAQEPRYNDKNLVAAGSKRNIHKLVLPFANPITRPIARDRMPSAGIALRGPALRSASIVEKYHEGTAKKSQRALPTVVLLRQFERLHLLAPPHA